MKAIFVKKCYCTFCVIDRLMFPAYAKAMIEATDKMMMEGVNDMAKIVQYRHHGVLVKVDKDLKGTHRDHCLCFRQCQRFHPEDRERNCKIANILFEVDRAFGIVTPVYECPLYGRSY